MLGIEADGIRIVLDCGLGIVLDIAHDATMIVRLGKIRVQLYGLVQVHEGAGILSLLGIDRAPIVVCGRELGIELERRVQIDEGEVVLTRVPIGVASVRVSKGLVGRSLITWPASAMTRS